MLTLIHVICIIIARDDGRFLRPRLFSASFLAYDTILIRISLIKRRRIILQPQQYSMNTPRLFFIRGLLMALFDWWSRNEGRPSNGAVILFYKCAANMRRRVDDIAFWYRMMRSAHNGYLRDIRAG